MRDIKNPQSQEKDLTGPEEFLLNEGLAATTNSINKSSLPTGAQKVEENQESSSENQISTEASATETNSLPEKMAPEVASATDSVQEQVADCKPHGANSESRANPLDEASN